jgi:5-methylcytosine-specific restriction endonuclease McrA
MKCRCGGESAVRQRFNLRGERIPSWQCSVCLAQRPYGKREPRLSRERIARLGFVVRRRRPNKRRRDYLAYMRSAKWQRVRMAVFARDGFECRLRLDGCEGEATTIDHKSYEHFGQGDAAEIADCRPACMSCNKREREQRIARRVLG